jgi:hypothetical protein
MAISHAPWDGSASRWDTAADYAKSCLINLNKGPATDWTKDLCKLPIREPNGDLNSNALGPAAAALNGGRGGVDAPVPAKKAAAKKLMAAYREAKMDPPPALVQMAK